jgi:two-component system, cell cycle sensor histidine kinase and response regulator CckA
MREKRPNPTEPVRAGSDLGPPTHDARRMPETMLGNIPGLIYRCRNDENRVAEYFSEGALDLTGYPAADFNEHRRYYADLIHPDDRTQVWREVRASLVTRQRYTLSYRIVTASGALRWVREQGCGVFDRDGSFRALEGFITDITEQRVIEAAMRLQSSALNAAANAIMITDRDGAIEWVNPAWTSLTGYSPAEAIGKTPRILKSGLQGDAYYEQFWRNILAGKGVQGEVVNRRKDGTLYHEHETITPVSDETGHVTHFIAIKQDITERKRSEADRERQANLLASTLRSLPGIFYLYDGDGRLLNWNDNFRKATGYLDDDLPGRLPLDFISPEDHKTIQDGISKVFAHGAADAEAHLLARDGTRTPYYFTGVRVELEGKPHLVGMGFDIAERRQSEERIRLLSRTYAMLSDINQLIVRAKTPVAILNEACRIAVEQGGFLLAWISQSEGPDRVLRLAAHCGADQDTRGLIEHFLREPQTGCAYTTQAFATGAATFCNDIEHEPAAESWRDAALQRGYHAMASFPVSIAGRRTGTFNLYAAHAGFFDADEVRLLAELAGDIGFGLEIHERERQRTDAETALRESEARFRTVLETVALIGLMLDREGRILLCSDYLLELTGWTRAEVLGSCWFDKFIPASEREQTRREVFLTAIATGTIPMHVENEIIARQGERRMIAWSNSIVRDSRGEIVGVTSLGEDITERRRAEQQVRKLASFAKLNPNPVLEFSADGELTYANPAAQVMAQTIGAGGIACLLPEESSALVRECIATGQPHLRLLTQHDRHTVSWSFHPIAAEGIVHCYAGDITERLALEEQLRQSQKMDAIGQLAGGVAHDFNNLLTVIQGNASMMQMPDFSAAECAEALGQISGAAERAAALTRQLLTFSRRQNIQLRPLDLNEAVTAVARMLQRVLGEQVHLQLNLHPRPLITHADSGMLDQVLMNLAVNARDAMPEGGQLILSTGLVSVEHKDTAGFPDARGGPHVCLRVTDTGGGIAAENLPHIFEPFFTTKEPGKGTGLGLATVFGIVKQHGGTLKVASDVGRGTTFEILLPIGETAVASAHPAVAPTLPRGSGETVLVVEDEPAVRFLAVRVLRAHGYQVLEAADGHQALRLCAEAHPHLDLLLTDMIMPGGISGPELARRLRAEAALRVLYMSGYIGGTANLGLELDEGRNFLQKPFTPMSLLACVRTCLEV